MRLREEIRLFLEDHKRHLGCALCGEDEPVCLDFHHRDPARKSFTLSGALRDGRKFSDILDEIQKCTLLCANCHRRAHRVAPPNPASKPDDPFEG